MDKKPFETIAILNRLNIAYKEFLDSPTEKNLKNILDLGSLFKESWIKDASNKEINQSVSSQDLDQESLLQKEFKKNNEDYLEEIQITEPKKLEDRKNKTGLSVTKKDLKKYVNKTKIQSFTSNSGLMKLISSSIYLPPIKQFGGDDVHIIQHDLRGFRYDENQNRAINRRWYVSTETTGDSEPQMPWAIQREDYDALIVEANTKEGFVDHLEDERINNNEYKVIFSHEIEDTKLREKLFNEITVPDERENLLKNDYRFVIFEADYFKYPIQYFNYPNGGKPVWRDVCIFNNHDITFRCFTNDLLYSPSIKITDNPEWILSNDMPSISNQAMQKFIEYTHPNLLLHKDPVATEDPDSKLFKDRYDLSDGGKNKN